ncbi:MAG: MATE family efflux transporter [Lachnospira sp.]|nr:MATE family efflux transporter [Lachnospira sp.]
MSHAKKTALQQDLTTGKITSKLWLFALPLMVGNVMQQFYNLVDTWVVGRYIGADALAAVGSAYAFMTFLISVIIGLCLGCSAFFSIAIGQKNDERIRNGIFLSFVMIGVVSLLLTVVVMGLLPEIIRLLQVPEEVQKDMYIYLFYVMIGLPGTFLYNYFANVLRGIGNSFVPLIFLGIAVLLNVGLDVAFVVGLGLGIKGAAIATTIAQYGSGIGLMIYSFMEYENLRPQKQDCIWKRETIVQIMSLSGYTCLQQSVMNFGILMVQGIVNGFGTTVMAAFAVAVKIDSIAYMPVQDFGNAFSTFVAQNYGAQKRERIQQGIRKASVSVMIFCICISIIVFGFAENFMEIFIATDQTKIIAVGVQYLRIEGACYIGIGLLFMLYGYYRAVNIPQMSLVLTIISLGSRVVLSLILSKISWIGVVGIWISIPIGWALADIVGLLMLRRTVRTKSY